MNYSRQRETVYDVLKSTTAHPSADWIYERCREILPNISLGTVYRNLELLVSQGKAIKVSVTQDKERYDADVSPHFHVACPLCGKVWDLSPSDDLIERLNKECADNNYEGFSLTFRCVCEECKNKQEIEQKSEVF